MKIEEMLINRGRLGLLKWFKNAKETNDTYRLRSIKIEYLLNDTKMEEKQRMFNLGKAYERLDNYSKNMWYYKKRCITRDIENAEAVLDIIKEEIFK